MADKYRTSISDVDSPAEFAFEIPDMHTGGAHTTVEVGQLRTDLTPPVFAADSGAATTRGLYVGVAGNVFCRMANSYNPTVGVPDTHGANVLFQGVPSGTILPIRVQAIWANNYENDTSNTTATGLVGLY
jgi:hypothetical protein